MPLFDVMSVTLFLEFAALGWSDAKMRFLRCHAESTRMRWISRLAPWVDNFQKWGGEAAHKDVGAFGAFGASRRPTDKRTGREEKRCGIDTNSVVWQERGEEG